jgi:hypothetical protein
MRQEDLNASSNRKKISGFALILGEFCEQREMAHTPKCRKHDCFVVSSFCDLAGGFEPSTY